MEITVVNCKREKEQKYRENCIERRGIQMEIVTNKFPHRTRERDGAREYIYK